MNQFTVKNKNGDVLSVIGADVWNEALEKFFQSRGMGDSTQGLALLDIRRDDLTIEGNVIHFPK